LVKKISGERRREYGSSRDLKICSVAGDVIGFKPENFVLSEDLKEFLSQFYINSHFIRISPHVCFPAVGALDHAAGDVVHGTGRIYSFLNGEVPNARGIVPEFDEISIHAFHKEGIF